eukprot:m.57715 g.57715  ORF g.57715 m.57715 type:complete len:255 (-) comp22426_c0_seq1:141-905(-)
MVKKGGFRVDVVVDKKNIQEYLPQNAVGESDPDLVLTTDNADAYVESNLRTPASYDKIMYETYVGGIEEVPWPVTPYSVKVQNESGVAAWWTLEVDGHRVTKKLVKPREACTLDGFEEVDGTKEFVFSLPRFAETETDRIDKARETNVGTIRCQMHKATFEETRTQVQSDKKASSFHSANKKDANGVTKGKFTMSTTQAGKTLRTKKHTTGPRLVSIWAIGESLADIKIKYRMGDVLERMGLKEKKVHRRRTQD